MHVLTVFILYTAFSLIFSDEALLFNTQTSQKGSFTILDTGKWWQVAHVHKPSPLHVTHKTTAHWQVCPEKNGCLGSCLLPLILDSISLNTYLINLKTLLRNRELSALCTAQEKIKQWTNVFAQRNSWLGCYRETAKFEDSRSVSDRVEGPRPLPVVGKGQRLSSEHMAFKMRTWTAMRQMCPTLPACWCFVSTL